VWRIGKQEFNCITRTRFETRFNVFSVPEHVRFAKWLVGDEGAKFTCPGLRPTDNRGVLLFYPTIEKDVHRESAKSDPVMGFALVLPVRSGTARIAFGVKKAK
jgi:hypothetical protein